MHGLIFETSIWLLAGSTRFLFENTTDKSLVLCLLQQKYLLLLKHFLRRDARKCRIQWSHGDATQKHLQWKAIPNEYFHRHSTLGWQGIANFTLQCATPMRTIEFVRRKNTNPKTPSRNYEFPDVQHSIHSPVLLANSSRIPEEESAANYQLRVTIQFAVKTYTDLTHTSFTLAHFLCRFTKNLDMLSADLSCVPTRCTDLQSYHHFVKLQNCGNFCSEKHTY